MSAREIIAEMVIGVNAGDIPPNYYRADAILSALSEAGYTIARLEQVEQAWEGRDDGKVYPVALYRVASPVTPPVSREAQ